MGGGRAEIKPFDSKACPCSKLLDYRIITKLLGDLASLAAPPLTLVIFP